MNYSDFFLYGSLLSGYPSDLSQDLHRRSCALGRGRIHGFLIDLGQFPALVYRPGSRTWVEGELVRLPNEEELMDFLDAYEGYDPRRPACENLYLRQRLPLKWAANPSLKWAWSYVFHGPSSNYPTIPESFYLDYFWKHEAHQQFARHPH